MITLKEINQQIREVQKDLGAPREGNETSEKWEKQRKKAAKKLTELNHLRK
jgi:hypothetical protein